MYYSNCIVCRQYQSCGEHSYSVILDWPLALTVSKVHLASRHCKSVCVGPVDKSGERALLGLQRPPSVQNFTVSKGYSLGNILMRVWSMRLLNETLVSLYIFAGFQSLRERWRFSIGYQTVRLPLLYSGIYLFPCTSLGDYTAYDLSKDLQLLSQPSKKTEEVGAHI